MPARRRTFIPQDEDVIVQPHPLSVAPLGQLLLQDASAENLRDSLGLLSSLPDEAIVMITDCCSAVTLARCSMVSRGLRIFCSSEELWRTRVIEELPEGAPLRYSGTWLQTYLQQTTNRPCDGARAPMGGRLFSDALFTSWFCGTASIPRRWTQYENIERIDASALSVAEFASRFEEPGVPVILTGVASGWTASQTWSHDALLRRFGQTTFNVGALQMRLDHFLEYSAACHDETPLYLFDKHFAAKAPELAAEYVTPAYFAPERDLFARLPSDCRPDYRWLIVGGTRSGSGWHVDPNASSAWNAVIRGSKKWILTPPGRPPPGITASDDGATVTAPVSLYEWYHPNPNPHHNPKP